MHQTSSTNKLSSNLVQDIMNIYGVLRSFKWFVIFFKNKILFTSRTSQSPILYGKKNHVRCKVCGGYGGLKRGMGIVGC